MSRLLFAPLFSPLFSLALIIILFIPKAFAQVDTSNESAKIVVHLLDYLAKDYGGAVQNGQVLSKSEYAEQVEFAGIVDKNSKQSAELSHDQQFVSGVAKLNSLIQNKASAGDVTKQARHLQQEAIRLAHIEVEPKSAPDLALGAKVFQQNCVSCHGAAGHGDGPAGASLNPRPANFYDPQRVWTSSPFQFYSTIRLGVPGTAMAPYSKFTDDEVWALAYYLKSLAYKDQGSVVSSNSVSSSDLATLNDEEIATKLGGKTDDNIKIIASLRTKGVVTNRTNTIDEAKRLLDSSLAAAKIDDYQKASADALNAYLQGIEPVEPKLKANLPGYVETLEGLMSSYRSSISNHESPQILEAKKIEIFGKLNEAQTQFAKGKMSSGVAFGAAFSIFLREGFEAVLIIIVLLSILRAMNQPKAIKWVHAGWMTAIFLGVVAWFASGILVSMSGLSRELLEGGISILAVVVLIYVGFWLHRYTEIKKWRAFLEEKLRKGLNKGSYFGLALVAFLAVFREAFEVVLFLRAIWIDLEPSSQNIAGLGVLSSFALLIGLSYFAVKESKKLPLTKLFQICSWTMMALAIILAGKGIHSLQEAGILGVGTIPLPVRFDLLGIYPSYQTLVLQLIVIGVFATLLFNDREPAH